VTIIAKVADTSSEQDFMAFLARCGRIHDLEFAPNMDWVFGRGLSYSLALQEANYKYGKSA